MYYLLDILTTHTASITSIIYIPFLSVICSGSLDKNIKIWNINLNEYKKENQSDFRKELVNDFQNICLSYTVEN